MTGRHRAAAIVGLMILAITGTVIALRVVRHPTVPSSIEAFAQSMFTSVLANDAPYRDLVPAGGRAEVDALRPALNARVRAQLREDSGYYHADYCFESGVHLYMMIAPGPPPKTIDFVIHRLADYQEAGEPCR